MVPDGRMEWTDRRTDGAKTISLRLRRGIIRVLNHFDPGFFLPFFGNMTQPPELGNFLVILYNIEKNSQRII